MPKERPHRYSIAVDAMGGDLGVSEVVHAVAIALKEFRDIDEIILVGKKRMLELMLKKIGLHENPRVTVHHASEVVAMGEKPIQALKQKRDSSLVRAVELVKEGRAGAVVSLGNTGALMAAATLKLRPVKGIERPALATVIPSHKHHFLLIDAGANPETTGLQLAQNAILGSIYYKSILPIAAPRVGLLTIGTEEGKGTERIAKAHAHLKSLGDQINYIGLIEGFDTFKNVADVVVTDGFTGNCVLKSLESCFTTLAGFLKKELGATPFRQLGAVLSKGAFTAMKDQLSPEHYSGAPLLGVNGLVLKTHGSSNRKFIRSAIRIANEGLRSDLTESIIHGIAKANHLFEENEQAEAELTTDK